MQKPIKASKESGRRKSRIPHFKSVEEEAAFWDSHDSTEFEDEFVEVDDVQFVKAAPRRESEGR